MPSYRAHNGREQYVGCYRFDQKVFRTGLNCLHDGPDILVVGHKHNWERGFMQSSL